MSWENSVEIDPVKKSIETDKQLQSRNRGSKTLKIGAILRICKRYCRSNLILKLE